MRLDEALALTTPSRAPSEAPRVDAPSEHPDIEAQAAEVLTAPKGLKAAQPDQNGPRGRRQAAQTPRTVEDDTGSVRKPRATSLVVPEEKRCEALTARGARCKAPRLRGLRVCMFHGHLASDDERLVALADPEGSAPRLSPRKALKAVAEIRAGEMAVRAVDGALTASQRDGGAALLRVVDAVDPQREESARLTVSADEVGNLSFSELTLAVRSLVEGGRLPSGQQPSASHADPLAAS